MRKPSSTINLSEDNIHYFNEPPRVGLLGSTILLCATTLGAGILAIPSTINLLGIAVGIVILVFFGICSVYSIYMLLVAGETAGVLSYEEVVESAFPKAGRIITTIFMDILLFGALTGFMVIIADQVYDVIHYATGGQVEGFYADKRFLLVLIAVFIIFPLSMLQNISKLEYSSFAAVAIIFCFTIIVIALVSKRLSYHLINWDDVKIADLTATNIFKATPIVSLAYTCQGSIFPIWKELENPTRQRMNLVQTFANIFSGTLYCIVAFFGYLLQPINTPGNILSGLPDEVFYIITRSAFAVAIIFHYPVVHYGFRTSLEVTIFHKYNFSWIRHSIETSVVVLTSTGLAILIPSLTKVFDLTGSIAGYPIAFMFPAICYVKIVFYDRNNQSNKDGSRVSLVREENPNSLKNLLDIRVIPAVLLSLLSLASSVISLYVTITEEFMNTS